MLLAEATIAGSLKVGVSGGEPSDEAAVREYGAEDGSVTVDWIGTRRANRSDQNQGQPEACGKQPFPSKADADLTGMREGDDFPFREHQRCWGKKCASRGERN